ncbi:MAG: hypothetical protein ABI337_02660 [Nitrososphaera sp.]
MLPKNQITSYVKVNTICHSNPSNKNSHQTQNQMMEASKDMTYHCIRIALENNCTSMKKLSLLIP